MSEPAFVTRWRSATHDADFGVDAEGRIWQYLKYEGCLNPRWINVRDDDIERQARASLVTALAAAQRDLAAERQAHAATRKVLSEAREAVSTLPEDALGHHDECCGRPCWSGNPDEPPECCSQPDRFFNRDELLHRIAAALAATPPPTATITASEEPGCSLCGGCGWVTEDVAQAGDQTLIETYRCTRCGGRT